MQVNVAAAQFIFFQTVRFELPSKYLLIIF